MEECLEKKSVMPYEEMTNEEYRIQIQSLVNGIDDKRLLRYFYVYISEKMKRVL